MKNLIQLAILAGLAIPTVSIAQLQKSLVGFQGIPWGSSIATVKAKFPNAKELDLCKMMAGTANNYQSFKSRMNDQNSSCVSLTIENYQIESTKFYAEFSFDPQNRLTYVTLTYASKQSDTENYLADCTSTYNRVSSLLEARYGENVNVSNAADFGKDYSNYTIKAWTPLPSEVWVANLSGDKFIKRMSAELNKPTQDVCKVKINYSKKVPSEAYKL